ncbi:MAG: hypothetical protein WC745_03155 [Patescibacteria group bacterium]|jgi:hypothetical protein
MIKFDPKYFKRADYYKPQTEKFLAAAYRDLKIASGSAIVEVKFQFSYNALIKLGISLIALSGYKVSSRTGHHVKIIEKASEILDDKNILIFGNSMRKTRNTELYDGGAALVSEKQADEYLHFVKGLFKTSEKIFKDKLGRLV